MSVDPIRAARCLDELGGIASARELAAVGVDAYALRVATRTGAIIRLREGVYGSRGLSEGVRVAVCHGGVFGCLSRLAALGAWTLVDDGCVHVVMPRNGRLRAHEACNCVVHWTRAPLRGGTQTVVEALAQTLACRGSEEFFVALESTMRKRLVTSAEFAGLRTRLPVGRRWLVDFARWDADSGLESLLRLRLHAVGISLQSQVEVPGVGRVDFVLGDRLILEVDGKPNHVGAAKRHKDLVRDAVAAAHGFDTLRFDYALVVHDWPLVEAAILAKVERGLHLGVRVSGRRR